MTSLKGDEVFSKTMRGPIYPFKEYKFMGFKQSSDIKYKYEAIIMNRKTGRKILIPFGYGKKANQYSDMVPLGLYIHLNDNNEEKRQKWREKKIKEGYKLYGFSPYYFEYYFLM